MRPRTLVVASFVALALPACDAIVGIQDVHPLGASDCLADVDGSDPDNCGACGRSCMGSACNSGECAIVELARGESFPTAIVVDSASDGFVYWMDDVVQNAAGGGIRRIAKNGSPDSRGTVYSPPPSEWSLTGLAMDGTTLFFTAQGVRDAISGSVQRIEIDGSEHHKIGTFQGPGPIGFDATNIYWANRTAANRIESASRDLTTTHVLYQMMEGVGDTTGLAVDPDASGYVFWVDAGLHRTFKDGSGHTLLENTGAVAITLDATTAFFLGQVGMDGRYNVLAMNKDGTCAAAATTCPQVLATHQFSGNMTVDATSVYWTTFSDGTVMAVDKDGTHLRTLTKDLVTPAGIAVDDVYAYITDQYGGRILKVVK